MQKIIVIILFCVWWDKVVKTWMMSINKKATAIYAEALLKIIRHKL